MWTLAAALERVSSRLGETSETFWSRDSRINAINDAVRFISSLTKGIPLTTTGAVDTSTPYVDIVGNITGLHGSAGRIDGGASLSMVRSDVADLTFPRWRTYIGTPRWVIVDMGTNRAYLVPAPLTPTNVEVTVAALPTELTGNDTGTLLFNGVPSMTKYLGALVNYAAAMLLLQERFDGDAERFYQFAVQELRDAGVEATAIPPMPRPVAAQE